MTKVSPWQNLKLSSCVLLLAGYSVGVAGRCLGEPAMINSRTYGNRDLGSYPRISWVICRYRITLAFRPRF